ncbi:unnamed protein product [Didymodactylos carnosus]|uniref:Uncharacterized protein n=1 Tax=Didymodactylos carnosus TaxID=1234261 RepID=A0A814RRN7_9BILA|nr:unnamed protein product [Didymodactylos carnosus]CAF1137564.1 unnamed protein product [Didymodactylos carnosus]CAF3803455.1 unnamed protein product [Didymodactylos carnosus]CAF3901295.1 unnamed protein product [Didymodactylos carnosus]
MAKRVLQPTSTTVNLCTPQSLMDIETSVRNELERYLQLTIEHELFTFVKSVSLNSSVNDCSKLLTKPMCLLYLQTNETEENDENDASSERKREETISDANAAKTRMKLTIGLDQQITKIKTKYMMKLTKTISVHDSLRFILNKLKSDNNKKIEILKKLETLYQEYSTYQHSTDVLLKNSKKIHQINNNQLAVTKNECILNNNAVNSTVNENFDQYEHLITLMFHKLLKLPMIEVKQMHLKPTKHNPI